MGVPIRINILNIMIERTGDSHFEDIIYNNVYTRYGRTANIKAINIINRDPASVVVTLPSYLLISSTKNDSLLQNIAVPTVNTTTITPTTPFNILYAVQYGEIYGHITDGPVVHINHTIAKTIAQRAINPMIVPSSL
jgi:hypothetical protein